jgi:hypothetical protein
LKLSTTSEISNLFLNLLETFESCFVVVKSSITFSDFSIETKTKHIEFVSLFLKEILNQINERLKKKLQNNQQMGHFSEKN